MAKYLDVAGYAKKAVHALDRLTFALLRANQLAVMHSVMKARDDINKLNGHQLVGHDHIEPIYDDKGNQLELIRLRITHKEFLKLPDAERTAAIEHGILLIDNDERDPDFGKPMWGVK